jgi:hypothetical protein
MKPVKATIPVARWMLRLTLLIFFYFHYFATVKGMNFNSIPFYFALIYLTSGVLLIFGALFSQRGLTILSSILIFVLSVYLIIKNTS